MAAEMIKRLGFGLLMLVSAQSNSSRAEIAVANMLEESEHVGVAHGDTDAAAQAAAIARCIARGGVKDGCAIFATFRAGPTGSDTMCVAGAQGYNGDFGYGIGSDKTQATKAAITACQDHAIAPQYCEQRGDIVCQPNNPLKPSSRH